MYFKNILLVGLIIMTGFYFINSAAGRGGGSRGGGSRISIRSGGSRSSSGSRSSGRSRSVSYNKIKVSVRYSSWSRRHGFASSFRYRTSSYSYKRTGITTGLIIMSTHQRSTFIFHRDSSYDDISICYNEFPLYDRNISISPWFVCPWENPSYRYCCGDEIEERCCRYFDRKGHLAGLIIGIVILIVLFSISYKYVRKFIRKLIHKDRATYSGAIIYKSDELKNDNKIDENSLVGTDHVSSLPYPLYNTQIDICPSYPQVIPPGESYSQYPINPTNTSFQANCMLQNPLHPNELMSESNHELQFPQQSITTSYDEPSLQYPLISEKPPPSYSDVIKNQN